MAAYTLSVENGIAKLSINGQQLTGFYQSLKDDGTCTIFLIYRRGDLSILGWIEDGYLIYQTCDKWVFQNGKLYYHVSDRWFFWKSHETKEPCETDQFQELDKAAYSLIVENGIATLSTNEKLFTGAYQSIKDDGTCKIFLIDRPGDLSILGWIEDGYLIYRTCDKWVRQNGKRYYHVSGCWFFWKSHKTGELCKPYQFSELDKAYQTYEQQKTSL